MNVLPRQNKLWISWSTYFSIGLLYTLFSWTAAQAQGVVGVDPVGRSSDAPPLLMDDKPPSSGQLPPNSLPPSPQPKKKVNQQPLPSVRGRVREIKLVGNTVLTHADLKKVIDRYRKREVSYEDLEELRLDLTRLYIKEGYTNSGAVLQKIANGVVTYYMVEGKLTHIEVKGEGEKEDLKWFHKSYISKRLEVAAQPLMNRHALHNQLQLLHQDDRIRQLKAELQPGAKPGESRLTVRLTEERPYLLRLGFDNYQSPTVGAERGFFTVAHKNLTGYGDRLSFTYGQSDGVEPRIDVDYTVPLTVYDTTLRLQYRKNDFTVVEEPFDPLDVESASDIYSVTLRHPVWRTFDTDPEFATQEVAVSLMGEHLRNKTFLLGQRFSFSRGVRDGKSVVSAVRFSLEWINRTRNQVFAARSRFSVGIDALGATDNRAGIADGEFFTWLGQFQWVRRLPWWDLQSIFRLDVQLTDDPLLSLEQIAIGGRYSVRGYRENQLVRDNGLISSLELRLPLVRNRPWAAFLRPWAASLELAPFIDFGRAWNTKPPTLSPTNLVSIGVGLRWEVTMPWADLVQWRPRFEIYWGQSLNDVRTIGGNIQDDGIHLQLLVDVF